MSQIKVYWQITVSDTKSGRIIRRTRTKLCRSFVKQFLQYLEICLRHTQGGLGTQITVTDTGNTGRALRADTTDWYSTFAMDAPVTEDAYGVVAGSDSTAETANDYVLGTQIVEGAGAGQLNHSAHTWTTSAVSGSNVDLKVQRPFINNSGGAVTIEEVGVYIKHIAPYYFCILRETTGTVSVANGQTATVSLTIRTTV